MTQPVQPGQYAKARIAGARVTATDPTGTPPTVTLVVEGVSVTLPLGPSVVVEADVDPGWPPLVRDVWTDETGVDWFAVDTASTGANFPVGLVPQTGDPKPQKPAAVRAAHTLTLSRRPGGGGP